MKSKEESRRKFIKSTIGAGIALGSTKLFGANTLSNNELSDISIPGGKRSRYKAHGLPTSILGKTGVQIPRIGLGLGSRFCTIDDEDTSTEMLLYALDNGLYYWDTAHIYNNKKNGVISEERIGKAMKGRRDEIFLSTKVTSRDPNEALREIEDSLKRLQTDKLDLLNIHSIESLEDIEQMSQKGNLFEILFRLKEEGVTRFIGYSGHGDAVAMKAMAERGDFDNMLIAMNQWGMSYNPHPREELAVPAAIENDMGVMLMKVVRPKETIEGIDAKNLVRFALSISGPNGAVIGVDSLEVVKSNLDILRNFEPMNLEEKKELATVLTPFFNHENVEWMKNDYLDGMWT